MNVPQNVLDTVYGSKPEDWKQHSNGGGWVYKTATVETSAYLHPTSIVSGNAWVYGDAQVSGNAWVYGNAQVSGDARVIKPIICASRSDGYLFTCYPQKDGPIVIAAGCRFFTFEQAREHWTKTRAGTPLGDESLLLVNHLEAMAKIQGWE